MSRRTLTLSVSLLLVIALAVTGALMSVPYVMLSPGPTYNTLGTGGNQPLIVIKGHPTYPADGHLNLVTVSVSGGPARQLGLFNALVGWLRSDTAVVPEEELYPKGTTRQESVRESQLQMEQSQQDATAAALSELGVLPKAIRIQDFVAHAPAADKLRKGDRIASVNGTSVTTLAELTRLISGHHRKPGDTLTLGVVRHGRHLTVRVRTMSAPDDPERAIVGIYPQPVWPFEVSFNLSDVGGPSAGMMFALGIIDKLTPGPLTGGRFVAGTGEIASDGSVGAIGGIAQKMAGARRDGAHYFLAPADNCADVRKADVPGGLQVIKVSTLHQAVGDVEAVARGATAGLPHC